MADILSLWHRSSTFCTKPASLSPGGDGQTVVMELCLPLMAVSTSPGDQTKRPPETPQSPSPSTTCSTLTTPPCFWGAACTCATRHLFSLHTATVVASEPTAGQYKPQRLKMRLFITLHTVAFDCCAETASSNPTTTLNGVFYEHESRRDDGPVGWYHHRSGATFDPPCLHPRRIFERSSRAEVERWRLAWIAEHDPDN